jgi:hypothetical protein
MAREGNSRGRKYKERVGRMGRVYNGRDKSER